MRLCFRTNYLEPREPRWTDRFGVKAAWNSAFVLRVFFFSVFTGKLCLWEWRRLGWKNLQVGSSFVSSRSTEKHFPRHVLPLAWRWNVSASRRRCVTLRNFKPLPILLKSFTEVKTLIHEKQIFRFSWEQFSWNAFHNEFSHPSPCTRRLESASVCCLSQTRQDPKSSDLSSPLSCELCAKVKAF